ncbi:unnamed protein product [Microthlaspi erraticum]|uniref:Uncharacterized protein n=1 Tax=Microthlaspi erraticum TaxID=1685480 RepID=A0A6D2INZ4_9BRAS|nr:unnamed protein product [Microthlaspi erraticum]
MYLLVTNVSYALNENYSAGGTLTELYKRHDSEGWMQVEDHNVLAGEASTRQSFSYVDELSCYSRISVATNGEIALDSSSDTCTSSSSSIHGCVEIVAHGGDKMNHSNMSTCVKPESYTYQKMKPQDEHYR